MSDECKAFEAASIPAVAYELQGRVTLLEQELAKALGKEVDRG